MEYESSSGQQFTDSERQQADRNGSVLGHRQPIHRPFSVPSAMFRRPHFNLSLYELDFLLAENWDLRHRPLYHVLVSATSLPWEARTFATQWDIMTIEPTRLPFFVLDARARRRFTALPEAVRAEADTILVRCSCGRGATTGPRARNGARHH